ncbi:MAG: Fe-S cluster assembly protein SufB [Candidatus Micrarchaeota archaeon]
MKTNKQFTGQRNLVQIVTRVSKLKKESAWMLQKRLQALEWFDKIPFPKWGPNLSEINFKDLSYYARPEKETQKKWSDVPVTIRKTFEQLGIPQAEREALAGVGAQFESESVYHNLKTELEVQGVIFLPMEEAVKKHPALVKKYFGTIVPASDNKFAALNTALWSGGSFIYIPKNVNVEIPLQAYFRINSKNFGQFERTLIIADEGSQVNYLEGCSAPLYSIDSLHAAVVEIVALKNSRVKYSTVQNWSQNVYNLVTKRCHAYENAVVEWIDANFGSKISMKYPAVYLLGKNSRADLLSLAFANGKQVQDTGGKVFHIAPDTHSRIISKSVSKNGGYCIYRGLAHIAKGAVGAVSSVKCDALLLDKKSRSDTFPSMKVDEEDAAASHEAYTGKISEEQLFYLRSRGFSEEEATALIVLGFVSDVSRQLPAEYAIELNNLIQLQTTGKIK